MKASVIIPTKNPGSIFTQVLAQVMAQETDWPFEIIVVDSGSTDGTLDFIRKHADVKLVEIPSAEFGHGRTRNLAISRAEGEFCALLTHDALPASPFWLARIVEAVEQSSDIAGAFGPHFAYPTHSPYVHRDLHMHFEGFRQFDSVLSRDTDPDRYVRDESWRQVLHYYSDNNSCMRRSVWEKIPYPDVEFAEDQIWAATVIEAGWKKAYAVDAPVYHSHEYRMFEQLQRAFDESLAFRRLFGYRLGASLGHAFLTGAYLSVNDWRWGRTNGVPFGHIARRMCNNYALAFGHALGTRGDRLPENIRVFLSRDKKLFKSMRPLQDS